MALPKPDYSNCGLNVIASIAAFEGLALPHPTLPFLDGVLAERNYRTVLLMLFDGLSVDLLEKTLPEDAFLRRHMAHTLSSVYPPTTTCATSTIECGQSPREHAWLGWTLYFPQIDKAVDIFTNQSDGRRAADFHVANRFIPRSAVFPRITAAGRATACCVSPFSDPPAATLGRLMDESLRLAGDGTRRYIYSYWPEPDHTMHEKGCYAGKVRQIVENLNTKIADFAARLPEDTLLLLTADHGLVDGHFLYLEDHPALLGMLLRAPTLESRTVNFYVKPDCVASFPEAFQREMGDGFLLLTGDAFIRDYLGPGETNPAVYDFVGDYVALATAKECIAARREETCLKGVHAGLTQAEMTVPLIVIRPAALGKEA